MVLLYDFRDGLKWVNPRTENIKRYLSLIDQFNKQLNKHPLINDIKYTLDSLERLTKGDEKAFLEIVSRYTQKAHNLAMRITRNAEGASKATKSNAKAATATITAAGASANPSTVNSGMPITATWKSRR